jgi:FAD dependent oxidoreductase TIGR03364
MFDDFPTDLQGQRVVVVGGGIIGTMHAIFAVIRGAEVVHLERDKVPHGATVRNFGLVWVSGRAAGRELELALRARELWGQIGRAVPGIGFRANGSMTLVRTAEEMSVIECAVDRPDAAVRGFELLDPVQSRLRNPGLRGEFLGALWCPLDAAVESRLALEALRSWMSNSGRYRYLPARELVGIANYEVVDHRGVHHGGDRVVLCLGAALSGFAAELFEDAPLRKVRLLMAETGPLGRPLTTSVADGDSLRYYPAFASDAADLLPPRNGFEARHAVQMLCQQRLHGGLTIGDTHETATDGQFDISDCPLDVIAAAARELVGDDFPRVERRWSGVYDQLRDPGPGEVYYRREVMKGVIVVTGAGGRGMTLAPAIAEESYQ